MLVLKNICNTFIHLEQTYQESLSPFLLQAWPFSFPGEFSISAEEQMEQFMCQFESYFWNIFIPQLL